MYSVTAACKPIPTAHTHTHTHTHWILTTLLIEYQMNYNYPTIFLPFGRGVHATILNTWYIQHDVHVSKVTHTCSGEGSFFKHCSTTNSHNFSFFENVRIVGVCCELVGYTDGWLWLQTWYVMYVSERVRSRERECHAWMRIHVCVCMCVCVCVCVCEREREK